MGIEIHKATINDLEHVIEIASNYPLDFKSYIPKFPTMIEKERVYVIKVDGKVGGFATFGISRDDPKECFTSSARSPSVTRDELSGDLMKSLFEGVLSDLGFRKFSSQVRMGNTNAIKMLVRNGYKQVETTALLDKDEWLQFCKEVS